MKWGEMKLHAEMRKAEVKWGVAAEKGEEGRDKTARQGCSQCLSSAGGQTAQ